MSPSQYFYPTWAIGLVLTVFVFWFTKTQPWHMRAILRPLALAVTFAPSFVAAHGFMPLPAIVVLWFSMSRPAGFPPSVFFMQGLLPIAIVWAVLFLFWVLLGRRD
jgi:hypothetical protein